MVSPKHGVDHYPSYDTSKFAKSGDPAARVAAASLGSHRATIPPPNNTQPNNPPTHTASVAAPGGGGGAPPPGYRPGRRATLHLDLSPGSAAYFSQFQGAPEIEPTVPEPPTFMKKWIETYFREHPHSKYELREMKRVEKFLRENDKNAPHNRRKVAAMQPHQQQQQPGTMAHEQQQVPHQFTSASDYTASSSSGAADKKKGGYVNQTIQKVKALIENEE